MVVSYKEATTAVYPNKKKEMRIPLFEMKNVGKTYDSGNMIAVKNVDLTVNKGEFISFVGPSGCGKSTLFEMIAGLSEPTSGSITFNNENFAKQQVDNQIAYVFQEATLMPWKSVIENVALPLKLKKVKKKERLERAAISLEKVGLSDYENVLPHQLSGGMKMRVSIARALINNPSLLLMDEPFGALDEITRQTLQAELIAIWKKEQEMTILFVTHNVFEAAYLSTRVVTMANRPGRISEELDLSTIPVRNHASRGTEVFSSIVEKITKSLDLKI